MAVGECAEEHAAVYGGIMAGPTARSDSQGKNSSIYVGDLNCDVTEKQLYEIFAKVGVIQSVRLCRDVSTRRPLGYAYVNYQLATDAKRALATLNHTEVCGRPVRLMPSQRDPAARRSGVGNIFAKNLDPDLVNNKVLQETFEKYGRVLSCKVATDSSGRSKGYGFVQYEDPEDAAKAIEMLNLTELAGQKLFVGPFIPAKDRAQEPGKFCNIYVRNISEAVDESTLRSVFGQIGSITSTVVMRNSSGRSRGFGFVNFENPDDAALAVQQMDGHKHNGLKWRVSRAQKREEPMGALNGQGQNPLVRSNLYLRNLDPSCHEDDLQKLFEEYGKVEHAKVLRDFSGKSKGVGFVQFAEPEDAEAAITGMNGRTLGGSPKPLFVTLAQRKQAPQQPQLLPGDLLATGMVQGGLQGLAPHQMPGMLSNVAYYHAGAPFYYGMGGMAMQPSPSMVNQYYMPMASMGSGPLMPGNNRLLDYTGNLVNLPGGSVMTMGSSPSAPLPGLAPNMMGMNHGQLPPPMGSESRNSAPLPMYGSGAGLLPDGHRRGRRTRGKLLTPRNHMASVPMLPPPMPPPPMQQGSAHFTSPFSAVQGAHTPNTSSSPLVRSAGTSRTASLSSPAMSGSIPEGFPSRHIDLGAAVLDRVSRRNRRWAPEVTTHLLETVPEAEIWHLLNNHEAFTSRMDACVASLDEAESMPKTIANKSSAQSESGANLVAVSAI